MNTEESKENQETKSFKKTKKIKNLEGIAEVIYKIPSLTETIKIIEQSKEILKIVLPIIPNSLREHINSGPLINDEWTIFVKNNSAKKKLEQLIPKIHRTLIENQFEQIKNIKIIIILCIVT